MLKFKLSRLKRVNLMLGLSLSSLCLRFNARFESLLTLFEQLHQSAIRHARDGKTSSWLTVLLVAKYNFELSAQEFQDVLANRYKKSLL